MTLPHSTLLRPALPRMTILALVLAAAAPWALSQGEGNGPTALIVSYHARPGLRVKFRSLMTTEGLAQLDRWKQEGVFASYTPLFTTYAADDAPDMFLILRFPHFTDLGRWQQIEKTHPGGLPENALSMASVESSATADIVDEQAAAPPGKDAQFFVLEYDVLADMPKYVSYVHGYVAPQFAAWTKAGALASYTCFVNQNPAGAPWSSFIILEYKNLDALATREVVKTKARAALAVSDPVWKKWSDDKSAIRKEKAAIPALLLR